MTGLDTARSRPGCSGEVLLQPGAGRSFCGPVMRAVRGADRWRPVGVSAGLRPLPTVFSSCLSDHSTWAEQAPLVSTAWRSRLFKRAIHCLTTTDCICSSYPSALPYQQPTAPPSPGPNSSQPHPRQGNLMITTLPPRNLGHHVDTTNCITSPSQSVPTYSPSRSGPVARHLR